MARGLPPGHDGHREAILGLYLQVGAATDPENVSRRQGHTLHVFVFQKMYLCFEIYMLGLRSWSEIICSPKM